MDKPNIQLARIAAREIAPYYRGDKTVAAAKAMTVEVLRARLKVVETTSEDQLRIALVELEAQQDQSHRPTTLVPEVDRA